MGIRVRSAVWRGRAGQSNRVASSDLFSDPARSGYPAPMRSRLSRITLRGFKTIRDLTGFEPGNLTVLIGPNGAGKSNFISFFRLLSWALAPPGQLQLHVASQGGASALLQQPDEDLPDVLILDEPELGLHPYAIEVIARLIHSASTHVQVVVATQSASLLDRFEPDDIVVASRSGHETSLRRLSSAALTEWLESCTLSELWEKNVVGGRPAH